MTNWQHWAVRVDRDTAHALDLSHRATFPFLDEAIAARTWRSLKRSFPNAGAAVLMPDHIHLLLLESESPRAPSVFGGIVSGISRDVATPWRRISPPTRIADLKHLQRSLRYVLLNPVRAKLTQDPTTWRWSTYRDWIGATVHRWPGPLELVRECSKSGLGVQNYVLSDSMVKGRNGGPVEPLQAPAAPRDFCTAHSLDALAGATAVALEQPVAELPRDAEMRRHFVRLAHYVGYRDSSHLARVCRVSMRTIQRLVVPEGPSVGDTAVLRPGLLALGEPRLREGVPGIRWGREPTHLSRETRHSGGEPPPLHP